MDDVRAAYVAIAKQAILMARTLPDLEDWFRGEAAARRAYGVIKGTAEYDSIVSACAIQKRSIAK